MPIVPQYSGLPVSLRRRTRLISGPACLPIRTAEVMKQTGLRGNEADPDLADRVKASTQLIEKYLNRVLVAQTWDLYLDDVASMFPSSFFSSYPTDSVFLQSAIELPKSPLLSVVGIYLTDDERTETAVDPKNYLVSTSLEAGRISLVPGATWPYHRSFEGFRIRFVAGYVVPFKAEQGVLTLPNNPFQGGEILRVSRGLNEGLPNGIEADKDYQIANVSGNTLQLLDPDGNLMEQADTTSFGSYSFLGELPEPIRREIAVMAAGRDEESEKANQGRGGAKGRRPVEYIDGFEQRLKYFRLVSI
jgi:hypothetical protein